jgi:hypothetical protein
LIQHAEKDLVEDHLTELCLDALDGLTHELGDVCDLDRGEGLDDPDQVLLEEGVVQSGEMGSDDGVV